MSERSESDHLSFYEISIQQYTVPSLRDVNEYERTGFPAYSMSVPFILSHRQVVGQPLFINSTRLNNRDFND